MDPYFVNSDIEIIDMYKKTPINIEYEDCVVQCNLCISPLYLYILTSNKDLFIDIIKNYKQCSYMLPLVDMLIIKNDEFILKYELMENMCEVNINDAFYNIWKHSVILETENKISCSNVVCFNNCSDNCLDKYSDTIYSGDRIILNNKSKRVYKLYGCSSYTNQLNTPIYGFKNIKSLNDIDKKIFGKPINILRRYISIDLDLCKNI
jgi:hypothetical protein